MRKQRLRQTGGLAAVHTAHGRLVEAWQACHGAVQHASAHIVLQAAGVVSSCPAAQSLQVAFFKVDIDNADMEQVVMDHGVTGVVSDQDSLMQSIVPEQ
jgi:hypothetical protein